MPSIPHLGLKILVEHLANTPPGELLHASDTALDHMIGKGDVMAVLAAAELSPERREGFMRNVLKLIENDIEVPVAHSIARLAWLVPALHHREPTEPVIHQDQARHVNLFEHLAMFAMLQKDFDAQLLLLEISNNLPPSSRGMLEPINYLGLSTAILQAVGETQNARLDDPGRFNRFLAFAEVAAIRCNYEETDDEMGTLRHLRERVASMAPLYRSKLRLVENIEPDHGPDAPPPGGRPRKPPRPRRDHE